MKVWIVWVKGDGYSFLGEVRGIYSTKEKAEDSIKGTYYSDAEIEEFEIDA